MSNSRKVKREKHAKKVEKQGINVVKWIAVGFIGLAIIYMAVSIANFS